MLATKGMRFPAEGFLVCIGWCAAYPLSHRHPEEMIAEQRIGRPLFDQSLGERVSTPA